MTGDGATAGSPLPRDSGSRKPLRMGGPIPYPAVIAMAGMVVMILTGATAKHGSIGGVIFSYAAAGVLAAGAIRMLFFVGVQVEQDAILIRGILHTRRLAWSQLQSFSFGQKPPFPAVGIANLRDGRKFAITAISTGRIARAKTRAHAEALIANLNQLLSEHGGPSNTHPSETTATQNWC